jgi:hypothetical protein
MHIQDLPDDVLLAEYDRADIATAVCPKRQRRKWVAYRSAILAELCRRRPVSAEADSMSDDELMRELLG